MLTLATDIYRQTIPFATNSKSDFSPFVLQVGENVLQRSRLPVCCLFFSSTRFFWRHSFSKTNLILDLFVYPCRNIACRHSPYTVSLNCVARHHPPSIDEPSQSVHLFSPKPRRLHLTPHEQLHSFQVMPVRADRLVCRRMRRLGDGIGPEIANSVQKIFEAAGVPLKWESVDVTPVRSVGCAMLVIALSPFLACSRLMESSAYLCERLNPSRRIASDSKAHWPHVRNPPSLSLSA